MVPQEGFKREGKGKITGEERRGGDRISGSSLLQREKKEEQERVCVRSREFLPREKEKKKEGGYLSMLLREPGRVGFVCPFRAPDSEKDFQTHEL